MIKGRKIRHTRSFLVIEKAGSHCGLPKTLSQKKGGGEDEEMAQQVKALVAKPGDRSLISRTNTIEGGPLTSTPVPYYVHTTI